MFILYKNEMEKIYKKKIFLVFLLIPILFPMLNSFMENKSMQLFSNFDTIYIHSTEENTPLEKEYIEQLEKINSDINDYNLGYDDEELKMRIASSRSLEVSLTYLQKGLSIEKIRDINMSFYDSFQNMELYLINGSYNQTIEEERKKANMYEDAVNGNPLELNKYQLDLEQEKLVEQQEILKELNIIEATEGSNKELVKNKNEIEMLIKILEANIKVHQYIVDNNVPIFNSNEKRSALNIILRNLPEYMSPVKTNEEYLADKSIQNSVNYEEYLKLRTFEIEAAIKSIETNDYPQSANFFSTPSLRTSIVSLMSNVIFWLLLISGLLAASSFGDEFKTGTIRMLAIRPAGRVKMYFSKFLAVMTLTAIIGMIAILMGTIVQVITFGPQDLGLKVHYNNFSEERVSQLVPLFIVIKYLISLIPIVLIISSVFLVVIAFQGETIGVITALTLTFSPTLLMFPVIMANNKVIAKIVQHIPLLYINILDLFKLDQNALNSISMLSQYPISPIYAISSILVLIIIMIPLSILLLKKMDIKK